MHLQTGIDKKSLIHVHLEIIANDLYICNNITILQFWADFRSSCGPTQNIFILIIFRTATSFYQRSIFIIGPF